jgi:ribonuclease P/MRP protein subunit POP1
MSVEEANRKRQRKAAASWKDAPAFCDAAATVSATTFGARRLPEIKELYNKTVMAREEKDSIIVSLDSLTSGGKKTSSRHLRRRATSHASRKRHRYLTANEKGKAQGDAHNTGNLSRRSFRKKASNLQLQHETWRRGAPTAVQQSENSPGRIKWMPTHIWHAKRFHMADLWGWKVPMAHNNRGPGASLRLLRKGKTLLQDVTWSMQPISLEAPLSSKHALQLSLARVIPGLDFAPFNALPLPDSSINVNATATGHGLVHGIDQFPKQAMGPVFWMSSRCPLTQAEEEGASLIYVYLWVHPSIRSTVLELLEQVLSEMNDAIQGPHQSLKGGISCLRLRGHNMMESLQTVLAGSGTYDTSPLQQVLTSSDDRNALESLRQGVTIPLVLRGEESRRLLLVSQCPRDPKITLNDSVCSLDIFCDPDVAKGLFVQLVLNCGACPVGVADESHFHLECHPPLPLFPRDYPDADESTYYWSGDSVDWKVIRQYWESGTGRFRPRGDSLDSIAWSQVVPEALADSAVVVVRGSFGKPFIDTLVSSANIAHPVSSVQCAHRKRRRAQHPGIFVLAPPLSKEQAELHATVCATLSGTLSLPALLLCHLHVIGAGTVDVGAGLHSLHPLDVHLGFATAGAFSSARGSFHAVGVVGAARLLDAVSTAGSYDAAIIGNRFGGGNEIRLRIRVSNKKSSCEASLCLLL